MPVASILRILTFVWHSSTNTLILMLNFWFEVPKEHHWFYVCSCVCNMCLCLMPISVCVCAHTVVNDNSLWYFVSGWPLYPYCQCSDSVDIYLAILGGQLRP